MGTWNPGPGATVGVDTFTGDGTGESADGLAGNDTLNGNAGNDTLRGNAGVDTINGGDNNDTLIIYEGDLVIGESYAGDTGTDTLQISGTNAVTDEAFTITGIEAITIVDTGDTSNFFDLSDLHFAPGGIASNLVLTTYVNLVGDTVSVTVRSSADADFDASGWTLSGFVPGDHINLWGAEGSNTLTGTNFNDWLRGLDGADQLFGGEGSDDLRGDEFADGDVDTLSGGAGNDYYVLSESQDLVVELANEGNDTVYSVGAYTLTANVENLYFDPSTGTGTGNELANFMLGSTSADTMNGLDGNDELQGEGAADTLNGGEGNDRLDGGAGIDTMTGGNGDDTYIVTDVGDATIETSALGGTDVVRSSITRTLGANIENLVLTGVAATTGYGNGLDNIIDGNDAANTLYGYDGSDTLTGGLGADVMYGGNGNDFYVVDNTGDITSEASALGGVDTVVSSVSRNLGANLENLILAGTAAITGAGNSLHNDVTGNNNSNTLYGFEGDDYLDGSGGADTLFGANGNDIYVVDDVNDITVESSPTGGNDTVQSWISRNLNANFENMLLLGTAQTAYGNVLNNVLTGNDSANNLYGFDGADTLNGGEGADQMFGADGDDTYIVDNAGDVTSEVSALGGTDTVISTVERNLTANIENLILTGSASVNGAGNGLNNTISGNGGANTLFGLGGDDTLNGGLGADTLQGGPGADSYAFTSALGAGNVDAIVGFSAADDTIVLSNAIFSGLSAGTLAASAFVIGAAAADADDRIIYNSATGALSFDADGNGAGAAVQFATLAAGLALTNSDFLVSGP